MSSTGTSLIEALRAVERPGDFCVGEIRETIMPTLDVDGVGRIAFPVLPFQTDQLIRIAEAAPHGRGEETLIDRRIRATWQIDAASVHVSGRGWAKTLARLVADMAEALGIGEPVIADFYKLLVYDGGSFFVDHRDTEKVAGMFATMVVVLPSSHTGGALVVKHLGREVVLDLHPDGPSEIGVAAFYADCVHEVRRVEAGCRLALTYNLRFDSKEQQPGAPDYRDEHQRVVALLRHWSPDEPDKLILPLEHAYTPAELSFSTLKGADAGVASVLVKAAAEAGCDVHLALVSIEESGAAEYSGSYGDRRRWGRDTDNEEDFEVAEVFDRHLTLSEWRRPDGGEAGLGTLPFTDDELCPSDVFEDLTPDEEHFHEATGNEGASFERTYQRAGLVLWPAARRVVVLNQAGLPATLPFLEDLTTRWEKSDRSPHSPLWRDADELAACMIQTWPRQLSWSAWRDEEYKADDDGEAHDAGRMLNLLVRLENAPRIDAFLSEIIAEGHHAVRDNPAIVRAAALLGAGRANERLVMIINRNAATRLYACGDLLRRCAAASGGGSSSNVGDLTRIGAALVEALPDGAADAAQAPTRTGSSSVNPGFIVNLLTATSEIDAGLAARAVRHMLTWPQIYQPDDQLVPAALALVESLQGAAPPAVEILRDAALKHLRTRSALPLEAPRDWVRANHVTCTCCDCGALGAFLRDPDQPRWRLKAVQERRSHVAEKIRHAACDLDITTERRGSPHTLVAAKNQASHERRLEQRRRDLQNVSALGG